MAVWFIVKMLASSSKKRKRSGSGPSTYKKRRTTPRARVAGLGELKFHDVDVDDASIATNGTIQNAGTINIIPQNLTESGRIGRKTIIKSVMWRYNLKLAAQAVVGNAETIRLVLYLDSQANGATATVAGAGGILEADNYQSFNNLTNSGRYTILFDKLEVLNPQAAAGDGTTNDAADVEVNGSFYKSCTIPLEFSADTGAITEVRSNNLGIMVLAKVGSLVTLDSKIRLRFTDN